jgi:hypothetical protein
MKIARQYSGPESTAFWNAVTYIKSKRIREAVYELGCTLQNLEDDVLNRLSRGLASEVDED